MKTWPSFMLDSSPSVVWQEKDEWEVESLKNNMNKVFKGHIYK